MNNNLNLHLATKKLFACDFTQIAKSCNASLDDLERDDFFQLRPEIKIENGIATIYIQELLTDDIPLAYEKAGMVTRYSTIRKEIDQAIELSATAIIFNINSGGGSVNGAIELSRYIASLPMPTAAVITSCACSAAYMIASATKRIAVSETAQVGNIGVIMTWTDFTAMDERMGLKEKAITNEGATLKSTFHLEPNSEQLVFLQETANQLGETFKAFVSKNRTQIDTEVFRAGWYSGQRAIDLGLADEII